jgi:hypothetical protein
MSYEPKADALRDPSATRQDEEMTTGNGSTPYDVDFVHTEVLTVGSMLRGTAANAPNAFEKKAALINA